MKPLQLSAVLLAVAVSGSTAFSQDNPAPAAPSTGVAPVAAASQNPGNVAINGFVYVEKLPTPTQLMTEAEAEQLTITRMDQSANRIVVVYQYPDGRTRTFAYTNSAPTGNDQVQLVTPASTSTATYTMVSPPPPPPARRTTVVYTEPERVVYYDSPRYVRYYEPVRDFWAPLAIGVGLGWGFGGHGHHHHGGFHGHGGRHR